MGPVRKLLLLCDLFAVIRAAVDCDNETFKPARIGNPYHYPYALLIVRLKPEPAAAHGELGILIHERVVLTKGDVGRFPKTEQWGVAGAGVSDIPFDLKGVVLHPAIKIVSHPKYNPGWKTSAYNMALMFLEQSHEHMVPAWMSPNPKLDNLEKVVSVYWHYDDSHHRLVKYTMSWCPNLLAVRPKCRFFNRASYLCLTTKMAGVPEHRIEEASAFPCSKDTVSKLAGGPVVSSKNDELLGMFLRIENEGSEHLGSCRVPKWNVIYFTAIRLLKLPDPEIDEATFNYYWINNVTKDFFGTNDDGNTTTSKPCAPGGLATRTRKRPFIYPASGAVRFHEFNKHAKRHISLHLIFIAASRYMFDF